MLHQTHLEFRYIHHSVSFSYMPVYWITFSIIKAYSHIFRYYYGIFRLVQAYSTPCVTLAYLQPCRILSPDIFRTRSLFETLWNIDQAYSEPCRRPWLWHIQNLAQCLHMQKSSKLEIPGYSELFNNCIAMHIQNPAIFTGIYECSELWHI